MALSSLAALFSVALSSLASLSSVAFSSLVFLFFTCLPVTAPPLSLSLQNSHKGELCLPPLLTLQYFL
jgi:hypothetical protein